MPNFSLDDGIFERAAQQFPTPFHLYDEAGLRARARRLNAAFAWCPDFREYFAVKALPNPAILRILKEEGCGLDCSSATELTLAKACGFSGEEVILSANAMPPEEFTQARALGAFINLDDLSDIELLRTHGGIPECVCLRYNPGGSFSIGNTIMGNPGEAKYGFTLDQLKEGLRILKAQGVMAFGLHAFLSSNTTDPAYYPHLAEQLLTLGRELAAESGLRFAFVDLSGSSAYFMEGDVTYSNEAKMASLGVKPETLDKYTAVSRECAQEMAAGMRLKAGTDYALATTGYAGPDGEQVGLVFVSLASKDGVEVKELHLTGDRSRIRRMAVLHALDLLRRKLCAK